MPHPVPKVSKSAAPSPVRINKALADAGLCSRRKAEIMIRDGLVTVNGEVATDLARKVVPGLDDIRVNGTPLAVCQTRTYIMMHKPPGIVCTLRDPQGRPTIVDILPPELRSLRIYPVGRLDYFSEGLLLLSDDGALAHRLAHPRHHMPKVYEVLVRGPVPHEALAAMRRGMTLPGGAILAPVEVTALPASPRGVMLRMSLRQGVNRQIRRMCGEWGLIILQLRRVSQGPLRLGTLPSGGVRPLTAAELKALREAAGLADPLKRL